jgi:hypothetical protein
LQTPRECGGQRGQAKRRKEKSEHAAEASFDGEELPQAKITGGQALPYRERISSGHRRCLPNHLCHQLQGFAYLAPNTLRHLWMTSGD